MGEVGIKGRKGIGALRETNKQLLTLRSTEQQVTQRALRHANAQNLGFEPVMLIVNAVERPRNKPVPITYVGEQ